MEICRHAAETIELQASSQNDVADIRTRWAETAHRLLVRELQFIESQEPGKKGALCVEMLINTVRPAKDLVVPFVHADNPPWMACGLMEGSGGRVYEMIVRSNLPTVFKTGKAWNLNDFAEDLKTHDAPAALLSSLFDVLNGARPIERETFELLLKHGYFSVPAAGEIVRYAGEGDGHRGHGHVSQPPAGADEPAALLRLKIARPETKTGLTAKMVRVAEIIARRLNDEAGKPNGTKHVIVKPRPYHLADLA